MPRHVIHPYDAHMVTKGGGKYGRGGIEFVCEGWEGRRDRIGGWEGRTDGVGGWEGGTRGVGGSEGPGEWV